jgi:hypothetical protein
MVTIKKFCTLFLKEEHRLRVFKNRVLRRIFDLEVRKWWEAGEAAHEELLLG